MGVGAAGEIISVSGLGVTLGPSTGVVLSTPTQFVQGNPNNPGLIVNGGDEAVAGDTFLSVPSADFKIQINGGLPPDVNAPNGDTLRFDAPGTLQVYTDKNPLGPKVSIGSPGRFQVDFTSIERTLLTPGNGVVQLIGDNNDPGVEQTDHFVVVGRDVDSIFGDGDADGANEFTASLNGSSPLSFSRVQFLNVFGADLTGVDGGQIDTLEVTPYADNTPRGWGVATFFDENAPAGVDGNQADLLIVHTSAFGGSVSENIAIQPSEQDAGEVVITNRGFGTPIANISFIANTDIIVDDDDGFTTDTDTLTLRGNNADQANGLTGNNTFNADFTAAGDAVNPIVSVFDGATLLYRLRTNAVPGAAPLTFNTINFETLGGNDTVNIVNRANGTLRVNVDGGLGNDTVGVRNTTAGVTTYTPGNSTDSGSITTPNGTVQLLGTELISLTGAVAGDTLTANGTHDNDTMALQFLGGANRIWINAQSVISFSTFGTVNLSGRFGDDKINVLPVGLVGVTTVSVNGGDSTNGDSVVVSGSAGVNNVTVTPTSADAATVTGLGAVVNIGTTESFLYNGLGGDDTLSVIGSAASDTIVIDHGANADSGKVAVSSLVPVSFLGLGASGILAIDDLGGLDRLIINGNNGNDNLTVNVAGDGIIGYQSDVSSSVGGTNHVRTTTTNAIEALLLNTLDGDDNFVINPSAFFPTGVAINAGNPSSGSDRVTINGTAGNDAHCCIATAGDSSMESSVDHWY